MTKQILVTGGAGFIGSALIRRLQTVGDNVITTIDNLSTGIMENIPDGVDLIIGDCQEPKCIRKAEGKRFDTIYHIAGQSSGEISFDEPVYDLRTNCESTLLLLQLARDVGCRKFIYASTMSVYGDLDGGDYAEESLRPQPKSFYGVGKVASESYMEIYRQFGINSVGLRLFNVFGPGQNLANLRQGMVSIYLAMAFSERRIEIKGAKERFRDFVYIDDVVDAFTAAERYAELSSGLFNIGTGRKTTVQGLISEIRRLVPFDFSVEYSGQTPGDQYGIVAVIDQARDQLGWQPKTTLHEGLITMIDWINRQKFGVESRG